jgi:O-6-methylguanine DNA methyltransferase
MSFSEDVHSACRLIPKGSVATYSEIARAIGRPRAVRAVGNALNSNPSPACKGGKTPCHRVIRSDGSVGGFAFGQKKKIAILEKEL